VRSGRWPGAASAPETPWIGVPPANGRRGRVWVRGVFGRQRAGHAPVKTGSCWSPGPIRPPAFQRGGPWGPVRDRSVAGVQGPSRRPKRSLNYLTKPFDPKDVLHRLEKALEVRRLRGEVEQRISPHRRDKSGPVGRSRHGKFRDDHY
jgi:hypothetical protein